MRETNQEEDNTIPTETCFEEILDFYHCVDSYTAPKIFAELK